MFGSNRKKQIFEREVVPLFDSLYAMALRLTQNEKDAEDLLQDSLVKAFRFFHRFEEGSNLKAWLFKVLVNTFYNSYRKNKKIARLQNAVEIGSHCEQFVSSATMRSQRFEEDLLDQISVEKLRSTLEELPDEFRTAVMLCDLHDFSYKEIADILGCPVGTVMSRLYRGRRLLQTKLSSYAIEQGYMRPPAKSSETDGSKPIDLATYRRQGGKL